MSNLHTFVSIAIQLAILLIIVKKDFINANSLEKVVTKSDSANKPKQVFVPKRTVDQVQGGNNPMTVEDPLIVDIIRS